MGWTFYNSNGEVMTATTEGPVPVFGRNIDTGGSFTTTSSTLEDVTDATVTFTTGAFPVAYGAIATTRSDDATSTAYFNIDIDGALEMGSTGGASFTTDATTANRNASFTGQSAALSAASHTIKLQALQSAGGTLTILATSATSLNFWAHEIR